MKKKRKNNIFVTSKHKIEYNSRTFHVFIQT